MKIVTLPNGNLAIDLGKSEKDFLNLKEFYNSSHFELKQWSFPIPYILGIPVEFRRSDLDPSMIAVPKTELLNQEYISRQWTDEENW